MLRTVILERKRTDRDVSEVTRKYRDLLRKQGINFTETFGPVSKIAPEFYYYPAYSPQDLATLFVSNDVHLMDNMRALPGGAKEERNEEDLY